MRAQSCEMGEDARILHVNSSVEYRGKTMLLDFLHVPLFIEEQAQFGHETDVRESDAIAYQELTVRC